MRIALVNETFTAGMGYTENVLPKFLARLGHDVHVLASNLQVSYYYGEHMYGPAIPPIVEPGSSLIDGFTLHRLPHRIVLGYPWLVGLATQLRRLHPDVVQVQGCASLFAVQTALGAPLLGYKVFTAAHQHTSVMERVDAPKAQAVIVQIKSALRRSAPGRLVNAVTEKCYAISPDCAEVAVNHYGVSGRKIEIVPLGCDTETFYPATNDAMERQRTTLRAELGFDVGDVVCIYTGRFSPGKDPLCLAHAVQTLRRRGKPFRGLFIGGGPQGGAIASTQGCVVRPFVRAQELAPLYRAADIGVWPRQESMSMIDAAACGLPLVVSHRLQATERIDGNGLTYQEGNAGDLASVLERLEDDQLRHDLSQVGIERMSTLYSWSRVAEARLQDYQRSLEPRSC